MWASSLWRAVNGYGMRAAFETFTCRLKDTAITRAVRLPADSSTCLFSYSLVLAALKRLVSTLRAVIEEFEEQICGGSFERGGARPFVVVRGGDQDA